MVLKVAFWINMKDVNWWENRNVVHPPHPRLFFLLPSRKRSSPGFAFDSASDFGFAQCSTFLPLPSFLLPSCLQDFCLPISGGLSQAPSVCMKLRFPLKPVHPQHIPPRTHIPKKPALTRTHTRAHTLTLACPPPSRECRRAFPPSLHTSASRAPSALGF